MREDSHPHSPHPPQMDFDVLPRLLRASKLRFGGVRAQGVPAILLGVSAVIVAGGLARSIATVAPMLPEALRETKNLLEATARDSRSLKP
jgi:hypothetical protein